MKVAASCPGDYMGYTIYGFERGREQEIVDTVKAAFQGLENPYGGGRFVRGSDIVGYVSAGKHGILAMVKKDSGFEEKVNIAIQELKPE